MHRSLWGVGMSLVTAGQLFIATGARAGARADERPVAATQPQPVAVGTRPGGAEVIEERAVPNTAMIGGGALALGAAYGTSVLVASKSGHPGDGHLYVPVVGPWLDLASRGDCGATFSRPCAGETTSKLLLIGDGVVQGLGALAIVGGFLFPTTSVSTKTAKREPPKPTFHVAPARIGYMGYGVTAFGTF